MLHRDGRKLIINLKNLNPVWWFLDKCINVRTIVSDVRSKSFKRSSIFRNNKSHKLDTSFQFDSNIKTSLTNFKKLEIKQRRKRNGGENSRKFCRKPRVRKIKKEEKERVNFNFPSPFLQRAPITTTSVTGRKRSYLSTLLPRKTQMQMQERREALTFKSLDNDETEDWKKTESKGFLLFPWKQFDKRLDGSRLCRSRRISCVVFMIQSENGRRVEREKVSAK